MRYKIKLFWGKLGPYCPFAQKGDFLRKLTNENIVYLLCPIMLQILKTFLSTGHITRYKVLQFWLKLDTNYRFTLKGVFFFFFEKLTDVNFAYFMYCTLSKCYNVQKKSLKWITRYKVASFLDKLAQGIFFGKINYRYFCQSAVPHHTKKFKLKKSLQRIKICKIQQFWSKLEPHCRVFPTGAENKQESSTSQKFAHSLSQYQENLPLSRLPQQMFILLQ